MHLTDLWQCVLSTYVTMNVALERKRNQRSLCLLLLITLFIHNNLVGLRKERVHQHDLIRGDEAAAVAVAASPIAATFPDEAPHNLYPLQLNHDDPSTVLMTHNDTVHLLPTPRLPPDQVFLEWQQMHSIDALRANPHNRTFMVAEYSCPRQAGNLLHDFTSALLLAIVTNRTLLYRYTVRRTYQQQGENRRKACERILNRADWIPSYDEWSKTLKLPPAHRMERSVPTIRRDVTRHTVIVPGNLRAMEYHDTFDVWNGLIFLDKNRTAAFVSQAYNINVHNDERVPKLYSQGVAYLYGMLFFESFTFTKQLLDTVQSDLNAMQPYAPCGALGEPCNDTFTIGIHSRHTTSNNIGGDVHEEIQCLDWLISKRGDDTIPCAVFIMADRPATIQNITQHLQRTTNCAAISVSPDPTVSLNNRTTNGDEHGPLAGAGFFRDLALVSQARSAFSGSARSSSALLVEWIDYQRRTEAWRYNHTLVHPLLRCYFKVTPPIDCDDTIMKISCL